MACAPVVQAVATAEFGPLAPNRTDTCPAARLTIDERMKKGETRSGPRSSSSRCSFSMTSNPPMPLPMMTPTRVAFAGSMTSPDSSIAIDRRGHRELDEAGALLDVLLVEPVQRIEMLDLAGEAGGDSGPHRTA